MYIYIYIYIQKYVYLSNPSPGEGGAVHGGAARRDGAGQDGTSTCRFAQETTNLFALQGMEDTCFECFPQLKRNKSYVNRWRNKRPA